MNISLFQVNRRCKGLGVWRVWFWWTLVTFIMRIVYFLMYRYRRYGMKHIPKTGSILIVANHQSNLDPALVGVLVCDRPFKGIARDTLFKSKFFSFIMYNFGVISIKRGESDTSAIRSAIAELNAGRCVLLFPEGTRTQDGKVGVFQRGFWLLMKRSKATILPVAIEGAFDVWPIGSKLSLRGYIEVEAGEPIQASELLAMGEEAGTSVVRSAIVTLQKQCRLRINQRSKK